MDGLTSGQITVVVTQRMLLGIGIVLGFVPLISVPFVALGGSGTGLAQGAMVLCGFLFLPACVLAYWQRRVAAGCFALISLVSLLALLFGDLLASSAWQDAFYYLSLPIFFTFLLGVAEVLKWPAVLAPSNRVYAER